MRRQMVFSERHVRIGLSILLSARMTAKEVHQAPETQAAEAFCEIHVRFAGVPMVFFPSDLGPDSALVATLAAFRLKKLSRSLVHSTDRIYFTGQSNRNDSLWRRQFNLSDDYASVAAAKGGEVVVFRNQGLSRGIVAHEMAHNLAENRYGSETPSPDSDYARATQADGLHPSGYGQNNLAEDFAESFRLYIQDRRKLRETSPRRYNVIRRLMKDEDYRG